MGRFLALAAVLLAPTPLLFAQAQAPAIDYDRDVRPILAERCFGCHGERQQQSGLRLDLRQQALRGGDYGVVIVPGNAAESKLMKRLIGSEAVTHFVRAGHDVVGIENDMRSRFFGPDASTARTTDRLRDEFSAEFRSVELDIRDADGVLRLFESIGTDLAAVVHQVIRVGVALVLTSPRITRSVGFFL